MQKHLHAALRTILFLAVLFTNISPGQTNEKLPAEEINKLLSETFKKDEPGAVVLLAKEGRIIFNNAYGLCNLELNVPMQADNIFRIGSITKQFTAIAILQLMEKGELSLQDEITRYIPDYPVQGYSITIEHLLTHTSGIQSYTAMEDYSAKMTQDMKPVEMIDYFSKQPMKFIPGTKWEYNNSGYFLLGFIIEKITGKTYGEYLEENFFKPLGMKNSYYDGSSDIIQKRANGYSWGDTAFVNARPLSMTQPYAAGSILSTTEDLFKWHKAVQSFKLVKKETLDKALTGYKLTSGEQTDYGFGWYIGRLQESPVVFHGGTINGFKSMELYLPAEDVYLVVFSNCDCNDSKEIAFRLAAIAIARPLDKFTEIEVDPALMERYTGEYRISSGFSFKVTLEQNKLFIQAAGQEKYEIHAVSENKFVLKVNGAQVEFIKDETGTFSKAVLNQNGRQTDAERINPQ